VFIADPKTLQRIAARMQRVLIVDPLPAGAKLLSELLRDVCLCQIWTASDQERGLLLAERVDPHIIFVEHCATLDGAAFSRDLRRSNFTCRKAPVIMISSEATASAIVGARDAGAHEFLRKPFTIKDLMRRLEAVTLRRRDWIEGIVYIGPDRRRFNSGDYSGPLKRRVDHAETADDVRLIQALRILKAALEAVDRDPRQAMRSMLAQVDELALVAKAKADSKLRATALVLGQHLGGTDPLRLRTSEIEPLISDLWSYLPADEAPGRPAAAA
jgi:DNA-binding response OmpR family regulator